ncbi:MAG: Mrp/NBP35 family ATP-binding protein [Saprospiraceae bacterium]|nr:Mrp/NBP35 family ATP-binding protein [Saprospiraceae bacterium]
MNLDNNAIVAALRKVKDPNSGQDIISVRMVEDFKVDGNNVSFSINLSGQDSKVKQSLNFACMQAVQELYPDAQVHIHLKSDSGSESSKNKVLPQVKNVIAVASGKGGVGKSTVSVNMAISLANKGAKVGLIDADLYGPSIPTMMGLQGQRPKVEMLYGKHKIVPLEAYGVKVMSVGFIVEPEQAIVLRGPRLGGIIKQFINECIWPELDYLIIDLPPGTGDIQLTLVQTVPVTGAVIVTTPQEVAVVDAVKAMNMFMIDNVNVPIIGVVENMSWFTPEELPDHKYKIFGEGGGKKLAKLSKSVLLGQIPLVQGIREGGDNGAPVSTQSDNLLKEEFEKLALNMIRQVQLRNEVLGPTTIVEMKR